jgi:hypothetical protein
MRMPPNRGKLTMKRVEVVNELAIEGDYGTGGRPLIKIPPNPYLAVDLAD